MAIVAALAAVRGDRPGIREVADLACRLEAGEAGIAGGRQDQFAAAYGGFVRLEFRDPEATVEPLVLDPAFSSELERRMLLCYTGASRFSGDTIGRVMRAYERGDATVAGALHALRGIAERTTEALRAADLSRLGELLTENWRPAGARSRDVHPRDGSARAADAERRRAGRQGRGLRRGWLHVLPRPRRSRRRPTLRARSACACFRFAGLLGSVAVLTRDGSPRGEDGRGVPDLRALRDRLGARARPLLERTPLIPDEKALLSVDGGVCPTTAHRSSSIPGARAPIAVSRAGVRPAASVTTGRGPDSSICGSPSGRRTSRRWPL